MQSIMPVLYDISLVFTIVSVMFVAFQKPSHDQKMLLQILYVCGIMSLGYVFKGNAQSLEGLVIGQKLIYFGGCFCYYLMLVFYLNYCGILLKRWMNLILIFINGAIGVIGFTFDQHTLLYRSYSVQEIDGILTLGKDYGPVHTIYIAEVLVCVGLMIFIAVFYRIKNGRSGAGKMVRLLAVVMGPTVAYILNKIIDSPYEFVPIGLMLALGIVLYLVYVEKIYDVSDLARQYAFKYMDSAYIVVDEKDRYRGSNELAASVIPELRGLGFNKNVSKVCPKVWDILNGGVAEIVVDGKTFELSVIDITEHGKVLGKLIWMSDVSDYRKHMELASKYQSELKEQVEQKTKEAEERREKVEQMAIQMVKTLANTIDAKDRYTNGHSSRVSEYAVLLAGAIGWSAEQLETLRYQGLLHDIGKIGIPDSILNKPSKLSDMEYEIIKSHTIVGATVLQDTSSIIGAAEVAKYHHERYDGKGYPEGLKGEQIPIAARIVGIADAYDAMNSNRVYRKSLTKERIREELQNGRGRQFDPDLTDVFLELLDSGRLDIEDNAIKDSWFYKVVEGGLGAGERVLLEDLVRIIKENSDYKGALEVDYGEFTELYEYLTNIKKRYDHEFTLCMVSMEYKGEGEISERDLEDAMQSLRATITRTIRGVDICTKLSNAQLLVVLMDVGDNVGAVIDRVAVTFSSECTVGGIALSYEIASL